MKAITTTLEMKVTIQLSHKRNAQRYCPVVLYLKWSIMLASILPMSRKPHLAQLVIATASFSLNTAYKVKQEPWSTATKEAS